MYELDKNNLYNEEITPYFVSYFCRLINNNEINEIFKEEKLNNKCFTNVYVTPISITYKLEEE